jgi:hypothetical protein
MSPFVVRIIDEFNTVFTLNANSAKEVSNIVNTWLSNLDSTPIYNIEIEVNGND